MARFVDNWPVSVLATSEAFVVSLGLSETNGLLSKKLLSPNRQTIVPLL